MACKSKLQTQSSAQQVSTPATTSTSAKNETPQAGMMPSLFRKASPVRRKAETPLQRRTCACGGTIEADGECASCRARRMKVQRKMTVNTPGDAQEQEADTMARSVLQRIARSVTQRSPASRVQRQPMSESVPEVSTETEAQIEAARGGGQPLTNEIRRTMEDSFDADFSGVRVHDDARSDQLNRSLDARAFTTGSDIFFKRGEYNPQSSGGQELLAHELTHTVQQEANVSSDSASSKANNNGFLQTVQRFETQIQAESLQLQHDLSSSSRMDLSNVLHRWGEGTLPDLAVILGIEAPKNPISIIEKILTVIDHPAVTMPLRLIPAGAALELALRTVLAILELVQDIIDNREQIIAEIKAFIGAHLDTIPDSLEGTFRELIAPLDPRHMAVLWTGYVLPMLKGLKEQWWNTIKEALWEQLCPWCGITSLANPDPKSRTGLGKSLTDIVQHLTLAFINLRNLNFSKAIDHALLAQKSIMGVANRFYGWVAIVIIASETIMGAIAGTAAGGAGAIPGAIAGFGAGLATAGAIGEVLLFPTIAIEIAIYLKSILSLHDFDSSLINEKKLEENHKYYQRIAESGISASIMLALLVLGYLAGELAGRLGPKLFALLPKNWQTTIMQIVRLLQKGARGEKPTAVDSISFRKNPPELNPELARVRELANVKENVRTPSDPELIPDYDAEISIGDHTYRRNRSNGTWCRFSEPVFCGIGQLEDLNAKVDAQLGLGAARPITIGEVVTVPYKGGLSRARVVAVGEDFVVVKYPSKKADAAEITQSIPRERFDRMVQEGDIIRWTQERQRLMSRRPDFQNKDKLVNQVWDGAKTPDGRVFDPDGKELFWDRSKNRFDQWQMGHKPGKEYVKLVDEYCEGKITYDEFESQLNNPDNYRPEDPVLNMSHGREAL